MPTSPHTDRIQRHGHDEQRSDGGARDAVDAIDIGLHEVLVGCPAWPGPQSPSQRDSAGVAVMAVIQGSAALATTCSACGCRISSTPRRSRSQPLPSRAFIARLACSRQAPKRCAGCSCGARASRPRPSSAPASNAGRSAGDGSAATRPAWASAARSIFAAFVATGWPRATEAVPSARHAAARYRSTLAARRVTGCGKLPGSATPAATRLQMVRAKAQLRSDGDRR